MIVIVDYQMGNLRSVQKAFERLGHAAEISSDPSHIANAAKLVLPGVGACGDAYQELARRGLVEVLRDYLLQDRPFLGICLGLQLLFEGSDEGGGVPGLGILPGRVVRFELPRELGLKVPHMGWNETCVVTPSPILRGIPTGTHFYYVHSYYARPSDASLTAMTADYPTPFCAAVQRGRLFATQFHPEKSQAQGLALLKNFAEGDGPSAG